MGFQHKNLRWRGEHSIPNKQLSALCALGCLKNGDGTQYLESVNVFFIKKLRGEGSENLFQYSSLESSMESGASQTAVLGAAKSRRQLSN